MFVKVTKSGPRSYVQLVKAYRDDAGRPRQRTIATLGRLDQPGEPLKAIHQGLARILGLDYSSANSIAKPTFESSRAFGDVWALTMIWQQLGLNRLRQVLHQNTHYKIDLEALLRIMVFNRLCDADSKLGILRWLQNVSLPDMDVEKVDHQQFLRTMDALLKHKKAVEKVLVDAVRPLVNKDLSLVFYDMTTIRAEGLSQQSVDVHQLGMPKGDGITRQFMLGLVQTAEGIPLDHEMFEGNTLEVGTLRSSLKKALSRFPVKRIIAVADQSLLSIDNLEQLQAMALPNAQPLEFILAVPGRRYGEFAELLEPLKQAVAQGEEHKVVQELAWRELRLIVAHDRQQALKQSTQRDAQIAALEAKAAQWASKLANGDTQARFYHQVCDAQLQHIIRVNLESELFTYDIDHKALALARAMDGKLLLVSNTTGLKPEEIVARYKSLADIKHDFRVRKSEVEIGPVSHRLPRRIRSHVLICFITLMLQRVMQARLRQQPLAKIGSPKRALAILRRIQTHWMRLQNQLPITGLSAISEEQAQVLDSLQVRQPTANDAYIDL